MRFERYMLESISSKKFWLVFFFEKSVDKLNKRRLRGVKGISQNKEILFHFYGSYKDTILVMDIDKVLSINNIEKIEYDNPEYLVKDDLFALRRIFNTMGGNNWHHQVYFNIFQYSMKYWKGKNYTIIHDMDYVAGYQDLAYIFDKTKPKIKNLDNLAKEFKRGIELQIEKEKGRSFSKDHYWKEINKEPISELKKALIFGLDQVNNIYSDEGEWIVKDDILNIPKFSSLIITDTPEYRLKAEQNNLNKEYKISFLDSKKFDQYRTKWFKKRHGDAW